MTRIYESDVEELTIQLLESIGYTYLPPEDQELERKDLADVVLKERLVAAVDWLNPHASAEAKEQAIKEVLRLPSLGVIENNEAFHKLLTEGIDVEVYEDGDTKGVKIWLVDSFLTGITSACCGLRRPRLLRAIRLYLSILITFS